MTFSQCLSQARKARGMSQEAPGPSGRRIPQSGQQVGNRRSLAGTCPRLLAVADALSFQLDDLRGRMICLHPRPHRLLPERLHNQTPLLRPVFPSLHRPPLSDSVTASAPARLRLRRIPLVIAFFLGAGLRARRASVVQRSL